MRNLAKKIHVDMPMQDVGSVLCSDAHGLRVAVGSAVYESRRATSCLLEPEVDDLVLVTLVPGRDCYVLAVLERKAQTRTRLICTGDLELQLPAGRLTVVATQGMSMVSGKDISCVAGSLRAHAASAALSFESTCFLGKLAHIEIQVFKVLGRLLESVLERLSVRTKCSFRHVEQVEQLRAKQVDYVASKNMSIRGRNMLLTAEELVKLDGDQVHLG